MAYPFLYAAAASILEYLTRNDLVKEDVEQWKEILTFLPSIVETDGFSSRNLNSTYQFVYGFHHDYRYRLSGRSSDPAKIHHDYRYRLSGRSSDPAKIIRNNLYDLYSQKKREKSLLSLSESLSLSVSHAGSSNLDGLPPHLVACLAYCALYPEGYIFVRETLIHHWIAQGFLGMNELRKEENGNHYFDELLHRWGVFVEPTFQFGDHIYSCRLDPLAHQAARRMASNEVAIRLHEDDSLGSARHIASHKETTAILPPSKTRTEADVYTYMCFTPGHQLSDVQEDFPSKLRVLDLAGVQFWTLPTFKASNLQYLGLSGNTLLQSLYLTDFPKLQTAAFDGCVGLETLNSTIKLFELIHLYYTSKACSLSIDAPKLRILQVSHCPNLTSLSWDRHAPLIRLRIFECPRLYSISSESEKGNIEELILHNCLRLERFGVYSSTSPQSMEIIGLPKLTRLQDWFPFPSRVDNIRYLMIEDCISLRSMDDILPYFGKLKKLQIYNCRNLGIDPSVLGSLNALKSVDLRKCPQITAKWTTDAARCLSHIPDVMVDGQRPPFIQEAVGAPKPTSSALPGSNLPRDIPFFILSSETFKTTKSSEGRDSCALPMAPILRESISKFNQISCG